MRKNVAVLIAVFVVGVFTGVLVAPSLWGPHYEALLVESYRVKILEKDQEQIVSALRETDARLKAAAQILVDSGQPALVDSALTRGVLVRR